jgi:hypothetical protein
MLQARQAKQISRLNGGAAVLVVGVWVLAACQAGELPCTKDDEWKAICAGSKASGGTGGGAAGSGGGGGGGSGGAMADAGGTGGKPAGTLSKDTPIANCAAYPTVGKMDDFFSMRCGVNATCHGAGAPWTAMAGADVWMALKDAMPKIDCRMDKVVDSGDWAKSLVWVKTRSPGPPACPTPGGVAGVLMPPADLPPKMPVLTADENTCLQGFLKAIAGVQ